MKDSEILKLMLDELENGTEIANNKMSIVEYQVKRTAMIKAIKVMEETENEES